MGENRNLRKAWENGSERINNLDENAHHFNKLIQIVSYQVITCTYETGNLIWANIYVPEVVMQNSGSVVVGNTGVVNATLRGYERGYKTVASPAQKFGEGKKFGGAKMFDFWRITLVCLEKRLSKHKMTIFSKHFWGAWSLWPPLANCQGLREGQKRYIVPGPGRHCCPGGNSTHTKFFCNQVQNY